VKTFKLDSKNLAAWKVSGQPNKFEETILAELFQ
jgi:hypothetical protein